MNNIIEKIGTLITEKCGINFVNADELGKCISIDHAKNLANFVYEGLRPNGIKPRTQIGPHKVLLVSGGQIDHGGALSINDEQHSELLKQSNESGDLHIFAFSEKANKIVLIIDLKIVGYKYDGNDIKIRYYLKYNDLEYNMLEYAFLPFCENVPVDEYEKAYSWLMISK